MRDVFIDTNILLYAYQAVETDKTREARRTIDKYASRVILSVQVIGEFFTVLRKKWNVETKRAIAVASSVQEQFYIAPVTPETVRIAFRVCERYRFTYWDSLLLACALEQQCDLFITEDLSNGMVIEDALRIHNPFA